MTVSFDHFTANYTDPFPEVCDLAKRMGDGAVLLPRVVSNGGASR